MNLLLTKPLPLGIAVLVMVAGGWQVAHAQVTTAELHGLVRDPSANIVPGAEVRVQNLDTGLSRTVQTAEDGSYSFLGLRPGRYSVYVEASGFRSALTKEIVLNVGQKAELSFRLEVSPIMEAIEVLSKTQMLEARRTSVSTTIVERLIRSLPSQSRDALNFTLLDSAATRENQASLPPIPATGFNIDGQQGRTITVTIDGVDAIDNTINGARITIPQDTVQEFEVLKSGYEAEHGKSSSAVINVVSKQGGNQLEGDVFALLRSRHVSATNAFAGEPDPSDTNTQAGFTLGGPLQRSRTFFFTGFDTTQENSTGFSTVGLDGFGLVEVANSYGMGSLLLTRAQAEFTRSTPASLAVPYSLLADRASHVALDGNLPGGPRNFGLIPNPLPASFRGLKGETGNYKTTYDSYVHSSRLDHLFGTHALFLRFGLSSSDAYGRPSNSQAQTDTQNAFSRTNNLFVRVEFRDVLKLTDRWLIRYAVVNRSAESYRLRKPRIALMDSPISKLSLLPLSGVQLGPREAGHVRSDERQRLDAIQAEARADFVASGQEAIGVVGIAPLAEAVKPSVLQFEFPSDQHGRVIGMLVL